MLRKLLLITAVILGALAGTAEAKMPLLTAVRAHAAVVQYGHLDHPRSVRVSKIVQIDSQVSEAILTEYGEPIGQDPFTGKYIRFNAGLEYPIVIELVRVPPSPEFLHHDPYDVKVYTYGSTPDPYYEPF